MIYHVALPDETDAACAATDGIVLSWAEVIDPAGRYFNCVECHKVLTAADEHAPEPSS